MHDGYKKQEMIPKSIRESMEEQTWFFNGENGRPDFTARVGVDIHNGLLHFLEDIDPRTPRLLDIETKSAMPITMISVYLPTPDRSTYEKDKA